MQERGKGIPSVAVKCVDIGGTPVAKAPFWFVSDAGDAKARVANGIRYPGRKRWVLGVGGIDPFCAGVNALSTPPGEYGRKVETQRN